MNPVSATNETHAAFDWTPRAYAVFRILLGVYLLVHFVHLAPWSAELFSRQGMLPDASASPLFGLLPNVLALSDAPFSVGVLLAAASGAAILLIAGKYDKPAALLMWYVLACIYARNPLIANPGLPYLGWMLLAHVLVPTAWLRAHIWAEHASPRPIFIAAWIVLALSYSYSGYTKLLSPSWVSGDTIAYVLANPLARDYFLREIFLAMPDGVLRALTWFVMYVELLFAPLALAQRLRPVLWTAMLIVQLGFLMLLNFGDLTTPMLLFHLLTFDPAWVRGTGAGAPETVYYDGRCGFCHEVVRFVLSEDRAAHFTFAPLQGASFRDALPAKVREALPDSFVVVDDTGRVLLKSDAVLHVMRRLGGLWGALAPIGDVLPRFIRDGAYTAVGNVRYRLFAAPAGMCPVVPPPLRQRFRD